ncbi:hypothetical protein IAU59_005778 [Kwoniella sp. CBS 9459]
MQSPNASSRFTLLPTAYLASQPPSSEITLQSLIDTSDRMAEEAREALPYSFDECTYDKGYLRQSVWSCLDCGEKGVCYGCSISCHAEHRLVELWTRRHFRCDCPTTSTQPQPNAALTSDSSSSTSFPLTSTKRRKCTLYPPDKQPQEPNEENAYTQNFKGKFCRCGREYDAETETEAMVCCIACEDWFHESCLNLRPASSSTNVPEPIPSEQRDTAAGETSDHDPVQPQPANGGVATEDAEEEDEESSVLIRSESYDGLICSACVKGNEYLRSRAGDTGWIIIEPASSLTEGDGEKWEVVGKMGDTEKDKVGLDPGADGRETEDVNPSGKRPLDGANAEEDEQSGKKIRLDEQPTRVATTVPGGNENLTATTAASKTVNHVDDLLDNVESDGPDVGRAETGNARGWKWKGKGDIFLANGIRDQLKSTLDEKTLSSLPFPLEDEEIYEPPKDDDQEETMDEVTTRVMGQLPRVQAIEALHGYQRLKDRLNDMLKSHVESGKSVSREDIEGLFEQLKRQRP